MAVEFKDYYAILGVPRTAGDDDIKKAFRKLARKYHPDVAKDKKSAEEKFKEINEANDVLSDPEKRRRYDELGANWQQGFPGHPPPRRAGAPNGREEEREFHFGGTGFSDFFEQFFGGRRAGTDFDDLFRRSARDAGAREVDARGEDIEGDILVTLHEAMNGSMRTLTLRRTNPQTGETDSETFTVRIPPGAREGRRIRIPGKGEPGFGKGSAGDLYLRVRLEAHPDFEVRGADLYHTLELAPWEAVLGAQVAVPTLSGVIKLRIPPGTTTGKQLRVRGQGLPQPGGSEPGDLYVVAEVQVPSTISEQERAAWETLASASRFNPRESET
jgi:curved DNA-binding protein